MDIDFGSGGININDVLLTKESLVADVIKAGCVYHSEYDDWLNYSTVQNIFGLVASLTIRFKANRLVMIDFVFKQGDGLQEDDYPTEEALLAEKDSLSQKVTQAIGMGPTASTLSANTYAFDWGIISVSANLSSLMCFLSIRYAK